ncbi:origin recognition complex subunit 1 isoform X2 [Sceloporus undulatus]|uniref:origin recognition complex subunit 1 isoform X2 n=1 Tax=Sceloporus undulatus TaxID=8520 RepID=UPI001C4CF71B|nr:origin recognition complex subunit 1 isoform X2 [Sceloporus undulatus]
MNTRSQRKRSYTWIGRGFCTDKQWQISHYRGVTVKSGKSVDESVIFLGEFILVEAEDTDQQFVARLRKLYEDGAQQKHAVVEWFSSIVDIPFSQRVSLGQESSQEIFFNENVELDPNILVTSIISNVTVIPLSPWEVLPVGSKDEKIFFIRKSWDGRRFKPLPPELLAELKGSVKIKSKDIDFATEYHQTPSRTVCSLRVEPEHATWNAREDLKSTADRESRYSVSKSSLAKQKHSQRIANGIHTPGAKKKLQLNSPLKSPRSKFAERDIIELDSDFIEPLERSAMKRKVTFTGFKGSPSKISCATDEGDTFADIKPLRDSSERINGSLSSPCQRNKECGPKTRRSVVKECATDGVGKQDKMNKTIELKDSEKQAGILTRNFKNQQSICEEQELKSGGPALTPRSRRKCVQRTAIHVAEQLDLCEELKSEGPALTPRLRRKCAQKTTIRVAEQLGVLETDGEEEDFISTSESSDSSSSDEEDRKVFCTPKRQMRSTSKNLRKPSSGKSAKDPSKTPDQRTPKTPRNATPRIRMRNQTTPKPGNALEEARVRLHVSAVPDSLPCREKEFQDICNFIESKLIDGTGGCMYISGVPGTGKTATVHEAIRYLQQAAENDELPSFQFIEINGMKLTDPHQAYVQILKLLTDQKATANHAAVLLEKMFCKSGSKRKTIVLVVDELDLLWTRKQNVMYSLFDWPTQKNAKLIVLAIANTMDLPERIMMNRVASRLGLTRMSFQPYTFRQLQKIISTRMGPLKAFEEDAVQLVSRKVAALSGDARRCLDICRRATEICELSDQNSDSGLVGMAHVMEAMDEMFSSSYISTIRNASLQEQTFLKAIIAEFRRSGLEEATVQQVYHHHVALCRIEGLQTPTISDTIAIASRLSACRLLLAESSHKYLHMRVRLNVSQDDVMYALKEE